MRNKLLLVLAALSVTACATAPSKGVGPACPSLPAYPADIQLRAADEIEAMPEGSIVAGVFMPDYAAMRAGVRACQKAQETK